MSVYCRYNFLCAQNISESLSLYSYGNMPIIGLVSPSFGRITTSRSRSSPLLLFYHRTVPFPSFKVKEGSFMTQLYELLCCRRPGCCSGCSPCDSRLSPCEWWVRGG